MTKNLINQFKLENHKISFIVGWFFFGVAILFSSAFINKSFFKRPLLEKIDNLSLSLATTLTPQIFRDDPNLSVVILEDDKGFIRGGMYNTVRINKIKYDALLERYKIAMATNQKITETNHMIIHDTLFQEKIYLHFDELVGFSAFAHFIINAGWTSWLSWLVYLGLGVFLAEILFNHAQEQLLGEKSAIVSKKINQLTEENQHNFHQFKNDTGGERNSWNRQKTYLKGIQMFKEQIKFILNQLFNIVPCSDISFFLYKDKKWQPYIQKHGAMFVKGNFPISEVIHSAKESASSLTIHPSSMLVTVGTKKGTVGLFFFNFHKCYLLEPEEKHAILQFVSSVANSLLEQRNFEQSTRDEETSFFTFPYFFMQLNNSIKNQVPFTTLVFEVLNFDNVTVDTLKKWGHNVICKIQVELDKNSFKNYELIAARISQERFAFIVETDKKTQSLFSKIAEEIENLSYGSGKSIVQVCGCVIPNMHNFKKVEDYLQILEQFILIAKQSQKQKVGQVT